MRKRVEERLREVRIDAEVEVVLDTDDDAMVERSEKVDVVFLPLRVQGMQVLDPFGDPAGTLLAELPLVAMVAAGEEIRLRETEEDAGPAEEAKAEASAPRDEES